MDFGARATGGGETTTLTLRFDKEPASQTAAGESTDGVAFFLENPKPFIVEAAKRASLWVRFTPFNSPPQETAFALRGLMSALRPLQRACAWDPVAEEATRAAEIQKRVLDWTNRLRPEVHEQVRRGAVIRLGQAKPDEAPYVVGALVTALREDTDHLVRIEAAEALGKVGKRYPEARAALLQTTTDANVDLANAAKAGEMLRVGGGDRGPEGQAPASLRTEASL